MEKKNKMLETRQVIEVPIDQIAQVTNARGEYRESELVELMTSMRQTGLLQPIGLRALGPSSYEVVFGNRRFVAAKKLGWTTVSAIMTEAELEEDFIIKNATENMVRSDITLQEQGKLFQRLTQLGLTANEIAARLGVPYKTVRNAIDGYRRIPKKYHDKIVTGTLGRGEFKKGKLSLPLATRIAGTVRAYDLSNDKAEKLFDVAISNRLSGATTLAVGKLLSQGYSVSEAVAKTDEVSTVTIPVVITKKEIERIEGKYNTSIIKFLADILKSDTRVKILRAGHTTMSDKVIVRKKAKGNT